MGIAYVDFDSTISPRHYPAPLDLPPREECLDLLRRLKAAGHTIHVWSARNNVKLWGPVDAERKVREMEDYLRSHNVPFDEIVRDDYKPLFDVLIDDRCIGLTGQREMDWLVVGDLLEEKGLLPAKEVELPPEETYYAPSGAEARGMDK